MEKKPLGSGQDAGESDPRDVESDPTIEQPELEKSGTSGPDGADLLEGSHRLMREISAEGRRVRTAFFVGTCLFLIVGALLILVAIFYLKLAVKQMEGRLDVAAMATADRFENRINGLFEKMDDQDSKMAVEIRELDKRAGDLANKNLEIKKLTQEVEEARKKEMDARFELRRALEAIDRERRELETRVKLLDDTLALVEKRGDEMSEDGAKEETSASSGEEVGAGESAPSSSTPKSIVLEGINRLLSDYSEEEIVIVDCERIDAGILRNPLIRAGSFLDEGSAVITPDLAVFSLEEGSLEITCYGGSYTRLEGKSKPLPGPGVTITRFTIASEAESLTGFMYSILGLTPGAFTDTAVTLKDTDPTTPEGILERLNAILVKERGGIYRFLSIESVRDGVLINVELEKIDASGEMENRIKAESCEVSLNRRDRYVEFLFKKGFFITSDQDKPFYNDVYRMPISNVNNGLWLDSGLRCLRVK